ncbi:MAG: hypothetical protein QM498_07820 [Desulfobacterium sp.]
MNDFLQSLRGGQKDKRTPKTRRGVDSNSNPHYNQPPSYPPAGYQNSRAGNVKRVTRSNSPAKYPAQDIEVPVVTDDLFERALDVLDGFLKNQERLVDIQQTRILIEERKTDALEEIAAHFQLNTQPGSLMKGAPVPEDEIMPGEGVLAETMENDFHDREEIEDPNPKFNRNLQENSSRQGRMMDPLSCANGVSGPEPSGQVDGDLFSSRTHSPVPGKKGSPAKESHRKVEPSSVKGARRISRSIEKNEIKKEVKVIKRTRAEKAKVKAAATATRVEVKTDETKAASSPVEGILPREEVMHIIETMREKGATFDQVATYLVSINQPTFSGRGEWHAQTVHRLCNRK